VKSYLSVFEELSHFLKRYGFPIVLPEKLGGERWEYADNRENVPVEGRGWGFNRPKRLLREGR
jgi:hypothetical protein